jgi:molybdopterin-guanine dinucleotide biosynthesis protein A
MLTVSIQAGGKSTRLPGDKALMPLAGKPLIEHVLRRVERMGDEILITTNRPEDYSYLGVRLVRDTNPGAGTLAGLQTAIQAANGDTVLVVACDMPFVQPDLLAHMVSLVPGVDVVVPRHGAFYEPMQAVYARSCLPAIEDAIEAGEKRVVSFYPEVHVRTVEDEMLKTLDPDGRSFFNLNTPEDFARAEEFIRESGW